MTIFLHVQKGSKVSERRIEGQTYSDISLALHLSKLPEANFGAGKRCNENLNMEAKPIITCMYRTNVSRTTTCFPEMCCMSLLRQ